jgi:hypothetical protein
MDRFIVSQIIYQRSSPVDDGSVIARVLFSKLRGAWTPLAMTESALTEMQLRIRIRSSII